MNKTPKLDIVIPVYNNSDVLEESIKKQVAFYSKNLTDVDWGIVIVNNASTDNTLDIAKSLARRFKKVRYTHINKKGRGNAVKTAWLNSQADFLSYMDVDLATDIKHFPELINNLKNGYDVSVGSKYTAGAECKRHISRYIISRIFNTINKLWFNAKFTDAQCGFKAIKKEAASAILPKVKDGSWFFDTELLVCAQRKGFLIKEVPITWKEFGMAKSSGVKLFRTCLDFTKKMMELRFRKQP